MAGRHRRWQWGMVAAGMLLLQQVWAQSVTLNLKDADISALITTVAEITGKNFIVDPRVKGKVTVISSKPMNQDEVYQVFLSILEVHSFAVVPSGEIYKIVPDVNAKQEPIPTVVGAKGEGDEVATEVIPVKNVSAAQLVPILRPLIPQQGHLAAYPSTNVLIISDRAANIHRLATIVNRIDQVSDAEVEVIPLQHASATEMVRILTTLAKPTGGQAGSPESTLSFIADERTNSVLMSGDRTARLPMRAVIAHLDTPLEAGGNTKVIYLRYAEAKDLVAVLKGVGTTAAEEAKGAQSAQQAARPGTQFDIQADEATNALVITAAPDVMLSLEQVIRQLDVRRAQVLVDAIIAEVSSERLRQLGVQWIVDGTPSGGPVGLINFTNAGSSIVDIASAILSKSTSVTVGDVSAIGGGRINSNDVNFAVLLQALASDTNTNILSTPTLVTLDNTEAEIVVGQNVPFVTGQFTNTGAAAGSVNPFQTIQREDVGLTLKIKPQINEGDAVKLDIQQEVSSIAPSAQGAADVVTNKRSIKTSVLVDDGSLVVLGGLIQDDLSESNNKVPLLGDVPVLGNLFRSRSTTKRKQNLMVFIHPVILRGQAMNAQYTGGKYNYIRGQQMSRARGGVQLMPSEVVPVMPELEQMLHAPRPVEPPTGQAMPLPKLPAKE